MNAQVNNQHKIYANLWQCTVCTFTPDSLLLDRIPLLAADPFPKSDVHRYFPNKRN